MNFLIFLDFDGVLHSNYGKHSALWSHLPRFEAVLRDYPEAQVVVSSSWGDGRSIDQLRDFFSPGIDSRIVDKVRTEMTTMRGNAERGDACRRFCRRHNLRAGDWIAIDDNPQIFKRSDPLLMCANGFREQEELVLRMVLAEEIPAWRFAFEMVAELWRLEFDGDSQRTRQYVLEHRTEVGGGQTLSQLLFARRRSTLEKHLHFMSALRPQRPPPSDEEMEARYGDDGPRYEMIDGVLCIMPRREKK